MCTTPKEGENRPLSFNAPILPQPAPEADPQPKSGPELLSNTPAGIRPGAAAATPGYAALPALKPLPKAFFAAALFSYIPAYIYTRWVLLSMFEGWGIVLFAALFTAGTDLFACALHRRAAKETPFWAAAFLLLSLFIPLYGYQSGGLAGWQIFGWHMLAVWYVLARCDVLAAGYSGSLLWLDGIAGLFVIPWGGFGLRLGALWQGASRRLGSRPKRTEQQKKHLTVVLGSAAFALLLCVYVWSQLSAADENFAAIGHWLRHLAWDLNFDWPFLRENLGYFIVSLPVGAWLFGLVGGSLRSEQPPCPAAKFYLGLAPLQRLPVVTVHVVLGALCTVYGLFFAMQAASFTAAALPGGVLALSGPSASQFAVNGFWELCRVLLLNFGLLAAIRFLGPHLLQKRTVKLLGALFCVFGVAFAVLAGVKIGVYIHLYAFTPRRVVSGWFVCILFLWAVLALLWVLGVRVPLGHAQLGVYLFVAAFLALSAVNMNRQIVRLNIDRYARGRDLTLELSVLQQCSMDRHSEEEQLYTRWLIEAGWFNGRPTEEIQSLYSALYWNADLPENGEYFYALHTGRLHLTLQDGVCAGAEILPQ